MTSRHAPIRSTLALMAGLWLLFPSGAADARRAQGSALTAERVVDWTTGTSIPLTAKVGAVSVQSVEFSDRGRTSVGGIGGLVRGGAIPDTSTVLRAHFLAENATADEWQVTFTLEFLDRSGKLIDRASKKSSWEGQAKPTDLDHPILQYVVPSIAQVRIRMEAKLD
jgi:hypothetical protein